MLVPIDNRTAGNWAGNNLAGQECTPQSMISAFEATKDSKIRIGFFKAPGRAIKERASLADGRLIASVVKIALNDPDFNVSRAAYCNLSMILRKRPDLGDSALRVAKEAIRNPDIQILRAGLGRTGMILENRPDLADEALAARVVRASFHPDIYVRLSTQRTLGAILDKRPGLADAALAKCVLKSVDDSQELCAGWHKETFASWPKNALICLILPILGKPWNESR